MAQVGRARQLYTHRREALLGALHSRGIEAHGRSGLNVWIPVSDEAEVVRALLSRGYCVRPGARYRLRSGPAIRITCAQLAPEQATRLADVLLSVLRPDHAAHAP
jgi:DNA-binding transcriptional MocR family regulator